MNIFTPRPILLLLALCLLSFSAAQVIQFAIGQSSIPPTPQFAKDNGANVTEGLIAFMRWYNDTGRPEIEADGVNYTLSLKVVPTGFTSPQIRATYQSLLNTSIPTFLFAPFGSSQAEYAASVADPLEHILMSSSASSVSWNANYKYAFSNWPTYYSRINSFIPFLRVAKMKTAAIIRPPPTTVGIAGEICNGAEASLKDVGITSTTHYFVYLPTPLNDTVIASLNSTAADVVAENPDVVMVCATANAYSEAVAVVFKEKNWTPKIAFSSTDNDWSGELAAYWIVADSYSDRNQFPADQYFGTAADYRTYDHSISVNPGTMSHSLSTWAGYSAMMVYNAIKAAKTLDQTAVADRLRRSVTETFLGRFSFDSFNIQLFPGTLNQIVNDSMQTFAPVTLQNFDIIVPMPTWAERVLTRSWQGVEIAALVFISLAIGNTIFWFGWIMVNRHNQTVVASAPTFLAAMLIGSVCIYVSMYLSVPYLLTTELCGARIWILTIGTTLLMGSMLAKTWRVYHLFTNSSMTVFQISDLAVGGVLGALLIPDIILLIIYQVVARPRLEIIIVDPYRVSNNYYDCVTDPTGTTVLWVIFGLHIATFLIGAFLAWKVRLIPYKIYDESKSIAFSIYNVGFFGVILAVILSVTQASHYTIFGLLCFLAILGSLITINVLFGSKFYWVKTGFDSSHHTSGLNSVQSGPTNSSSLTPYTSSQHRENKLEEAQERIESLKKRVKKLKRQLAAFETQNPQSAEGTS